MIILVMVSEYIRSCPHCGGEDFVKDYKREETYCNNCGLVLQSAFQYIGLEKITNIVPFSAPAESRSGIHMRWYDKGNKGKVNNRNHTRYTHNISDRKLMRYGR